MSTLREAAQQALEALEIGYDSAHAEAAQYHAAMAGYRPERHAAMDADVQKIAKAITALCAALAQEQEPVLVVEKEPDYMSRGHFYEGSKSFIDPTEVWKLPIGTKLYTHPPRHDIEKAYESACKIINEQDKKLAELEAVNQELLKALCALVLNIDAGGATLGAMYDARAAIAKAEGQT